MLLFTYVTLSSGYKNVSERSVWLANGLAGKISNICDVRTFEEPLGEGSSFCCILLTLT